MLIKTLLNKVERFKSFIYDSIGIMLVDGVEALVIDIKSRLNGQPIRPECGKRGASYDRQSQRLFEYLSVWSFNATCAMRRAVSDAQLHGIKVEALPWSQGKKWKWMTFSYQTYLACWARWLS